MRLNLPLLVLVFTCVDFFSNAQQLEPGEAEKRRQFLKAREEMRTIPATPRPSANPASRPKPQPARPSTPQPTPVPQEPQSTPRSRPDVPPKPREQIPAPATPRPQAAPTPAPRSPGSPSTGRDDAPRVTIEKSGTEQERGFQPAPPVSWWSRWKYLSKDIRREIDRAPVKRNRWRYIVVHNSGTRQGSAKAFEYYHLHVRKMPNGLAYHFVIGNGSSTGDGQIEIGNRWRRQINGGHVHSDYLNNIALGICLVGDYNRDKPTQRQLEALEELIRYLRQRVGRIDHKWSIVKAHREINPPRWPTDCPGDRFPYSWLHGKFD